jgi:hypothetical protein
MQAAAPLKKEKEKKMKKKKCRKFLDSLRNYSRL